MYRQQVMLVAKIKILLFISKHQKAFVFFLCTFAHVMTTIKSFQGLRFFFISLIVLSHVIPTFDFGGDCGVAFFFMLSGFILSYSYSAKITANTFSTKSFIIHQLRKFYPLYLTMLLLILAMNIAFGIYVSWPCFIADILMIQSWFPSNGITFSFNGPAWFLSSLMFCYLLFLPAFKLIKNAKLKSIIAIIVLYVILNSLVPDDKVNDIIYVNPLSRFFDFALGIYVYRAYDQSRSLKVFNNPSSRTLFTMELILVVLFLLLIPAYTIFPARIHCASLFWPFMALTIFCIPILEFNSHNTGMFVRIFSSRLLVSLGGISMEMFITQAFVLRVINGIANHLSLPYTDSVFFYAGEFIAILIFSLAAKKIYSSFTKVQLGKSSL